MAGEKRLSNNPFLSTLHQRSLSHQRMAALMRVGSSLPLSPDTNALQPDLPTTTGVIQMRREDLPLGMTVPLSSIQAMATAPTLTSFNKIPRPSRESDRISPVQPSDTPRQEPAQALPSPVQRPSAPPAILNPSSQPAAEGNLEDAWPRLEAIFERHEETRQQPDEIENAMPAEEELTPPEIASPEEKTIESEMNVPHSDNETEKYTEQIPPASPQSHLPQAVVQKQADNDRIPETPQEVEENEQPMEAPLSVEKTIPLTRPEPVEAQEQSSPSKVKPAKELPLEEDAAQKRIVSEVPAVEEEDEVEAVLEQAVPLNAAWPVEQRVVNPADYSSSVPTLTAPSQYNLQETPNQAEQFDQVEKVVHSALKNVPVEHPSRSSMEVITPRRSRPVIQRQSVQIEETHTEEQLFDGETHSDSQSNASIPSSQTDLIETDVGPLPADLWALLDQPLPSETTDQLSHPIITETQSVDKFAQLEEAIASAEKYTPPISRPSIPASQQPSAIQRSEEHPPSSALPETPQILSPSPISQNNVQRSVTSTELDSRINEGEQENEEEKKGFDLESLSRKVYAEIKRRFQRERERDR
ncbi:MAG: hypothetical protein K8R40_12025 [Anaerolineaceae bacterium]|nr:hypothetical protein [Anaerolineaceae bacterium]